MFERFIKKTPTSAELERVRQAHADADPTTYSALSPTGSFEHVGTVRERGEGKMHLNDVYESEGDTWYELSGSSAAAQRIASRLLKGIIPVSDVVERDGKYYSKYMQHERINERLSEDEVRADFELMQLILDDSDHLLVGDPRNSTKSVGHNARLEQGTATYHDFGELHFGREEPPMRRKAFTQQGYVRLLHNLERIREQYESPEGRVLAESIYSALPPGVLTHGPITFDEFYTMLLGRIHSGLARVRRAQTDQYGTPASEISSAE